MEMDTVEELTAFLTYVHHTKQHLLKIWFEMAVDQLHFVPSCTLSCCHCCYQLVMTPLNEGLSIAHYLLSTQNTALITAVISQMDAQKDWIDNKNELYSTFADTWFRKQIPCIFLADKKCQIYDIRPLVCSSYFTDDPAERCAPGKDSTEDNQVSVLDNSELLKYNLTIDEHVCKILWKDNPKIIHPMPLAHAVAIGCSIWVSGPESVLP